MVNFYNLEFKRVAIHRILAAQENGEPPQVVPNRNLIILSDEITNLIQDRLSDAAKQANKTFELDIDDTLESGFFGYAKDIPSTSDSIFIDYSAKIAQRLADSQINSSIPGGFLIVIDSVQSDNQKTCIIVIKAEPQEVVKFGGAEMNIIKDAFLSTSSRLYKFGVLYQLDESEKTEEILEKEFPNNEYGCMLFDSQFSVGSKPAMYFYKDFLGFTTEKNSKIQSKVFYDSTQSFILKEVQDFPIKKELLEVLDMEFKVNKAPSIKPSEFAELYFQDQELIDTYQEDVIQYLPEEIEKNESLIKSKLKNKKVLFPNKIILSGPADSLDANVQVISSNEELKKMNAEQDSYTIIRIKGKPWS